MRLKPPRLVRMDSTLGQGVLVQAVNHATGVNEWKVVGPDYDYNRELARAAFADMLHDSERNKLYYLGLKAAIKKKKCAGQQVHVLDIGTGTGLLSMMAAASGADSVIACEEFAPMKKCAEKVIAENGFADQIKVIGKRSTELTVGPGCDMEQRANILVTEVFDTELIGEGAIGTYNHANRCLLTNDRLVVPGVARMYAQVVSSKTAARWDRPHRIDLPNGLFLDPPPEQRTAGASLALHDVQLSQLSQLSREHFTPVTQPVQVFELDLACREGSIPLNDQSVIRLPALASGSCDAVFMWWDCWTDPDNTILLSCAPHWAHHSGNCDLPWRDHWMQAIYYPRSNTRATKGEDVTLVSCHDEYSLWFDVKNNGFSAQMTMPEPTPGLHMAMSRMRLGQVNCQERNDKYIKVISNIIKDCPNPTIFCLSEQSLLPLIAAKLGAAKVLCFENNKYMKDYIKLCAKHNGVEDRIELFDKDCWTSYKDELPLVDAVVGEPNFSVSMLPWHNLLFWFCMSTLNLPSTAVISPFKADLWMVPVEYKDLWKIRAPLGSVEGFKMTHFDEIIEAASDASDSNVEPQPLWEYPCKALAMPHKVLELDLQKPVCDSPMSYAGEVALSAKANGMSLNGMALWMDFHLDAEIKVSGGPVSTVEIGRGVEWDMDTRQGVHFFKRHASVDSVKAVRYLVNFLPNEGDFSFTFDIIS